MIQRSRFNPLNNKTENKKASFVLYWMQAAQRSSYNHALEYSIERANELNLPLVVYFGLTDSYPNAQTRHYSFMLEGLRETERDLENRGIRLFIDCTSPEAGVIEAARDAALVVTDDGYTRIQREWRKKAGDSLNKSLVQVDTNVVIPVSVVSEKQEYAARTIRPKIHRHLADYLVTLEERKPLKDSLSMNLAVRNPASVNELLQNKEYSVNGDNTLPLKAGPVQVGSTLNAFIENRLNDYHELRNDPSEDYQSEMSPYLHFGQISPLEIALAVSPHGGPAAEAYLEELIVRRELAVNFTFYNPFHDSYKGIPDWAKRTLAEHADDPREYLYTRDELEKAKTHDEYWNAAQRQMVLEGKMHGYMRMYWAKKILQWSITPEDAFETALYLNDKYELDGRDPNGYCGVSWCFGTHDRPWKERPVFGKIRYMAASGLKRKFNIDAYARKYSSSEGTLFQAD